MDNQTQIERTFSMIKPDAVSKNLIGEIIKRFEGAGLTLVAGQLCKLKEAQVKDLYKEHEGKEFYQGLVDFALEGPVFKMVLSGPNAVAKLREVVGKTNPKLAAPGTVRGDLAKDQELPRNMVHASDSLQSAAREIAIFFKKSEIVK